MIKALANDSDTDHWFVNLNHFFNDMAGRLTGHTSARNSHEQGSFDSDADFSIVILFQCVQFFWEIIVP